MGGKVLVSSKHNLWANATTSRILLRFGRPSQNKGGARLTKAALSTAGKSGPLGPFLGVDHTPGQTRDFATSPWHENTPLRSKQGKNERNSPRTLALLSARGLPETRLQKVDVMDTVKHRWAIGV